MNARLLFLSLWCAMTGLSSGWAQESHQPVSTPYRPDAGFNYTADVPVNLTGGISQGAGLLGAASISLGVDTEGAGLWKNGTMNLLVTATHGMSPSVVQTGDFHGISNISAGNRLFLQEAWYRHSIGEFSVTAGLQDLNAVFTRTEPAMFFLNSSFGLPAVLPAVIPLPVFPVTGLGITGTWQPSSGCSVNAAIYDGFPEGIVSDSHTASWSPGSGHGVLAVAAVGFERADSSLPFHFEGGLLYHSGRSEKDPENGTRVRILSPVYGVYFSASAEWSGMAGLPPMKPFFQLAVCPEHTGPFSCTAGYGITLQDLWKKRPRDETGIACSHSCDLTGTHPPETVVEISYRLQLFRCLFLQPDFQYIINPSGTGKPLSDAAVFILRTAIHLPN